MLLNKLLVRYKTIIFLALLVLGFFVRLYRFDSPIADWHSWRQADTSAVSRNFVNEGFDLLHPRFDDLSNVPSGLDNPNGYRFVEFPIYNLLQAGTFKLIGIISLEQWGRLVSIFASLTSCVFLYLLIKKRFGDLTGFLTSFFFLFIPFNIYFSRTILPDSSMVAAILGATYFFQKWLSDDRIFPTNSIRAGSRMENTIGTIFNFQFSMALILTASALLLKPYALFFTLPIIYLAFEKFGFKFLKKWQLWVFLIASIAPLVFWRNWITQFPEGIPSSNWLFNGNGIRFRPSFFYWIFYQRLTKLILGYFGVLVLIPVILKRYKRNELYFILSFVFSSLIYVSVLATGNVQHDYYQILIIPTISIVLGIGSKEILNRLEKIKKYLGIGTVILLVFLSFYFSWEQVKDYFNINNRSIIEAGIAVDKFTPKNAKIIANYNGDTSFLYQTKRKGWASFEKPLPEMTQSLGADFLVLANPTAVDLNLSKTYKIVRQTKEYVIFNLREKP